MDISVTEIIVSEYFFCHCSVEMNPEVCRVILFGTPIDLRFAGFKKIEVIFLHNTFASVKLDGHFARSHTNKLKIGTAKRTLCFCVKVDVAKISATVYVEWFKGKFFFKKIPCL